MKVQPRSYQIEAVKSVWNYFQTKTGNPVLALPTGSGKSVVQAMILELIYSQYPGQRVMCLTHVKELISQNHEKLLQVWPQAPAGIYSAGLKRKEVGHKITFAGIGSVARKASLFGHIDLVFIDEAHLVSPHEETLYRTFLNALLARNPMMKIVGLTATPWRLGVGKITDDGIFTDICFDITGMAAFNRLIAEGYMASLIPRQPVQLLDTTGVHMRGGEFIASELQIAVNKQDITHAALKEALELAHDRNHWLVFASGVEHACNIADMLNDMGVSAIAVHSKMGDAARDEAIAGFKAGKYRVAVNNNVLTTGFDFPAIDCIIMLRPTASTVLWCLSEETEVLTPTGFKTFAQLKEGDDVCGYLENGEIVNTTVTGYIHRSLEKSENLLHYGSRQFEFSVTDTHNMLYQQRGKRGWETRKAQLKELHSTSGRRMFISGMQEGLGVNLSVMALTLLGLYLSDGTFDRSNNTLVFYQSERYLSICETIEQHLDALGLAYRLLIIKPSSTNGSFATTNNLRKYIVSRTSRTVGANGWSSIFELKDFDKELHEKFQDCTKEQFKGLLHGINLGDGSKFTSPSINWEPKTSSISTGRKKFADNLQRLCIRNGHACRIASNINNNGNPIYMMHIREALTMTFKPEFLTNVSKENSSVWCIENPTGNIVTRYNGHIMITGNCQMLGRGTRPFEGKANCLVLDFAGNTRRLGPINDPVIPHKKGEKGGEAPVKLCEPCQTYNHASARVCCCCGAEFSFKVKIQQTAASHELIRGDAPLVTVFKVDHITYSQHEKLGRPPMLRATYYCGIRSFAEFVCIQHDGPAQRKARQWWKERTGIAFPENTADALAASDELLTATHLKVWVNKKYPEILAHCFDGTAFGQQAEPTVAPTTNKREKAVSFSKTPEPQEAAFEDDDIPF